MRFASTRELRKRRPRRTADVLSKRIESDNERIHPAQEITPEDWKEIEDKIKAYSRGNKWDEVGQEQAKIISVFPDKRSQMFIDQRVKGGMQAALANNVKLLRPPKRAGDADLIYASNVTRFMEIARDYLTLFPDDREGIPLDAKRAQLLACIEQNRRNAHWYEFGAIATNYVLLFPGAREELALNNEVWEALVRGMNEWRAPKAHEGMYFRQYARFLCILFPERKHELQFDSDTWVPLRKEKQSAFSWSSGEGAFRIVHDMMIFDADKIEILPNGELKLSKKSPQLKQAVDHQLPQPAYL